MRHGGGGGGGFSENPTPMYGTSSAVMSFVAAWLFITMPMRWPLAFCKVLLYAIPLATLTTVIGEGALASGWVLFPLLICGWHISRKYMTHTHYRPSPRRVTPAQRQEAHLAKYTHLRSAEAWRTHINKEGGK